MTLNLLHIPVNYLNRRIIKDIRKRHYFRHMDKTETTEFLRKQPLSKSLSLDVLNYADPFLCAWYSINKLKTPWPIAKKIIKRNPLYDLWYNLFWSIEKQKAKLFDEKAHDKIIESLYNEQTSLLIQDAIIEHGSPYLCLEYSVNVLHQRWKVAEIIIKKNTVAWAKYKDIWNIQ